MRHLAPTEAKRDFNFVAFFDEPLYALRLEIDVVLVGLGAKPYFLQQHDLLVLPCLAVLFLLLVLEAPVVEEAGDWRDRVRRYLDEVEALIPCELQRLSCWQNAQLLAFLADDSDLANPNPFIYPKISADRFPPLVMRYAWPKIEPSTIIETAYESVKRG